MRLARGVRTRGRTRARAMRDAALARLLSLPLGHADYCLTRDIGVPMRDGVELLTDVYQPVGRSRGTLLLRTPYGRAGPIADLTAGVYAAHGFLVVNQSCRGTSGSGGRFEPFAHERDDGADTVAWLRGQPWFTGRFAVVGPSYLGFAAWAIMVDPPPELATAVIAITAHDNHWVAHGSGAFSLEQMLSLLDSFGHQGRGMLGASLHTVISAPALRRTLDELPLIRAQETLLAGTGMPYAEWLTASDPDDPVWRTTRFGAALDRIDVPVLLQGGWQDRFAEQQFEEYARLSERGFPVALTVGDWTHVDAASKVSACSPGRRSTGWTRTWARGVHERPCPPATPSGCKSPVRRDGPRSPPKARPRTGGRCRPGRRRRPSGCFTCIRTVPSRRLPRPIPAPPVSATTRPTRPRLSAAGWSRPRAPDAVTTAPSRRVRTCSSSPRQR